MRDVTFRALDKPLLPTMAEHVSVDPGEGLLGNVGTNLGRGLMKMQMRSRWQDQARRMDQAIDQFKRDQALAARPAVKTARLEDQLGAIVEDHDLAGWLRVPEMVVALFKQAAPAAARLAAWADSAAGPMDRLWWHGASNTAWAEIADGEKRADWECLPDVPGVPEVALFIEPIPPPPVEGWVLVKAAQGYLAPIFAPHRAAQAMIGGPNGLTSAIVSGLLGGGLGYGAGWLADQFLPEEHVNKGRLPMTLGLAGLGLGAAPGLWRWSAELRGKNLPPGDTGAPPPEPLPPHRPGIWESSPPPKLTQLGPKEPLQPFGTTSPLDANGSKIAGVHPWMQKAAQQYGTGAMFLKTIPVDAFNQAVWGDVQHPASVFGTKSPWDSNDQPMYTPPYAAAAVSGLVSGTGQAVGSPVVSPMQVAAAAAMGAGKGWLTGMAAGKILGALAGLKPSAQQQLQQAGTWAGLITGVANSLYR
jgi:hypothetical protein